MARWKLTEAHYLNVPGTKWEYIETDRITGRPKRTPYPVPLLLDPNSLDDLKVFGQLDPILRENGDPCIIVTDNKNPIGRDIYFEGQVTPGMLPLDDEASAISEKTSGGNWDPTRGIDPDSQSNSYTNKLLNGLIDKMTEMKTVQEQPQVQGVNELLKAMTAMMEQNQKMMEMLVTKQAGSGVQRKVA